MPHVGSQTWGTMPHTGPILTFFLILGSESNTYRKEEAILKLVRVRTKEEEAFWQKLILPEDDLRRQGWPHVAGGYRWFRAPNVIPIERWKRPEPDQRDGGNDAPVSHQHTPR